MAVACEPGKRRGVVPLQFRLWSTEDPEYKGENAEIEAIIESIRAEVGNRGIYVYARGIPRTESKSSSRASGSGARNST